MFYTVRQYSITDNLLPVLFSWWFPRYSLIPGDICILPRLVFYTKTVWGITEQHSFVHFESWPYQAQRGVPTVAAACPGQGSREWFKEVVQCPRDYDIVIYTDYAGQYDHTIAQTWKKTHYYNTNGDLNVIYTLIIQHLSLIY